MCFVLTGACKMFVLCLNKFIISGVLLIDEMKLTKTLGFNRDKLKLEGFTDLGRFTPLHQTGKKGDHALVFLFQPFQGT